MRTSAKGGVYGVTGLQRKAGVPGLRHPPRRAVDPRFGARCWGVRLRAHPRDPVPACTTPRTSCAAKRPACRSSPAVGSATRSSCGLPATATRRGSAATSTTTTRSESATSRASSSPLSRQAAAVDASHACRSGHDKEPCPCSSNRSPCTTRDLHDVGDDGWTAPMPARRRGRTSTPDWCAPLPESGDVLVVTWANGLYLSMRVAERLAAEASSVGSSTCAGWRHFRSRRSPATPPRSVASSSSTRPAAREASVGDLAGPPSTASPGPLRRVAAVDSFIPLAAAANLVLVVRTTSSRRFGPVRRIAPQRSISTYRTGQAQFGGAGEGGHPLLRRRARRTARPTVPRIRSKASKLSISGTSRRRRFVSPRHVAPRHGCRHTGRRRSRPARRRRRRA